MSMHLARTCASILLTVAGCSAFAVPPASYRAAFKLSPGSLATLKTGYPSFDGDRQFTGAWTEMGTPYARTFTTDLASFTTGPDGQSFVPTWGAYGYSENRDRGSLGPHSFGGSFATACGLPGGGCATGSHTASGAFVFGQDIGAGLSLTDLYARADTQAHWSRGFTLDPHASFTFSGLATVSITGDEAPLQGGTRVHTDRDAWMTLSSMTFGDLLGRARTSIGTSVWGNNSLFAGIDYLMGSDGLMSITITNHSDTALLGRLSAGTYINVSPPIPEPGTWLMLLAGLGLVGSASRRGARRGAVRRGLRALKAMPPRHVVTHQPIIGRNPVQPSLRHALAAILFTLVGSPTLAFTPADYSASFQLTPGNLAVLKTGIPVFDGNRPFNGAWTDFGLQDARTRTSDLASFSTGPDGQSFIPTWGGSGYDENRGRGSLGPHRFGESFAFAYGAPGSDNDRSHTGSTAGIFGEHMSAKVSLTDLYARADTQASWGRGFALDPYASFTFSGLASVSIVGDDAPLQSGTRFASDRDSWMTVSSMTFGDLLGRARTAIGASLWGNNSLFADIDYVMGADGLMSMTITNHSDATLLGRINAGTYIDLSPPIPEPATWLMLTAGAWLVAGASRRRSRQRAA